MGLGLRQNSESETNEDHNFARCRYCGFPLDKSRDRTIRTESKTYTTVSGTVKNAAVNSGCPFCGCPQPYTNV